MHPNQPSATWGNGPVAGGAASGESTDNPGGIGGATTGVNGGGGGSSKKKDAAGAGNSTASSRAWKAKAGKAEGEADAASLMRTLALSNFGDRPVFLEVQYAGIDRSDHSQRSREYQEQRAAPFELTMYRLSQKHHATLILFLGSRTCHPAEKVFVHQPQTA